jgi:hypothetical protein
MTTKKSLKHFRPKQLEITTKLWEKIPKHKPLDNTKHKEYNARITKEVKKVKKEKNNKVLAEAKIIIVGISLLAFVVAEAIAAYVLYFSGQTPALKIVAGVLVVDASIRACKQFVNR